ncbi:hypothetical protein BJP25_15640 [Actinokineospora bangkokensis]|uniref:Uncharacterized protein n=1 Tax=Actinokineospora bangkokensis TaxID=1193682 RepID=A0A1Q9LPD4_9PSEU|nr:hypothetical protein BJP25_15640 [Actinokineospora bangkokensis]
MVRHSVHALRGRDLSLWAAGLTFFSLLAGIPLLIVALRGGAVLAGGDAVRSAAADLVAALPDAHDGQGGIPRLVDAALTCSWVVVLVALVPATFYGEGLRRGMRQLAGSPVGRMAGWKGRLGFLPVVALGPVFVTLLVATAPAVRPLYTGPLPGPVWAVIATFHVTWLVVSTVLSLVYTVYSPSGIPATTTIAAGFGTGAVVAGFLHGFLVFLAIPVDWATPFAGVAVAGTGVALALWLYLLHVLVLLGYRVALSAHAVRG